MASWIFPGCNSLLISNGCICILICCLLIYDFILEKFYQNFFTNLQNETQEKIWKSVMSSQWCMILWYLVCIFFFIILRSFFLKKKTTIWIVKFNLHLQVQLYGRVLDIQLHFSTLFFNLTKPSVIETTKSFECIF